MFCLLSYSSRKTNQIHLFVFLGESRVHQSAFWFYLTFKQHIVISNINCNFFLFTVVGREKSGKMNKNLRVIERLLHYYTEVWFTSLLFGYDTEMDLDLASQYQNLVSVVCTLIWIPNPFAENSTIVHRGALLCTGTLHIVGIYHPSWVSGPSC